MLLLLTNLVRLQNLLPQLDSYMVDGECLNGYGVEEKERMIRQDFGIEQGVLESWRDERFFYEMK